MLRRGFMILLGGAASWVLAAGAQQPAKVSHIGYIWFGPEGSDKATMLPGFRQGLRELGYQEDGNIVIEYRYADNSMERLHELVGETVAGRVDVILAGRGHRRRCGKASEHHDSRSGSNRRSGRVRLGRQSRETRGKHHWLLVRGRRVWRQMGGVAS